MEKIICDALDYDGETWRLYLIDGFDPGIRLQRQHGSAWIDCPISKDSKRYQDVMAHILQKVFLNRFG
tara:strand:+ start:1918 stop:2121 length:204 start_codon:yes stop_codon:yes gene_type:complete